MLEGMAQKGLVFRHRVNGEARYSAIPFLFGLIEFQFKQPLSQETRQKMGQYSMESLAEVIAQNDGLILRTIPVHQAIEKTSQVAPYNDVCQILKKQDLIVVTDCACSMHTDCIRPREVCFTFGPMAEFYLENGWGRKVDVDEAMQIFSRAHDAGLVSQPATAQNPFGMCNCCPDCCGFLASIKFHPRPTELIFSNYRVLFDQDKCSGCGTCVTRYPVGAATIDDSGLSAEDFDGCLGCGLCVTTCPENAVELRLKPENKQRIPPVDTGEQHKRLRKSRGLDDQDPEKIITFGFGQKE